MTDETAEGRRSELRAARTQATGRACHCRACPSRSAAAAEAGGDVFDVPAVVAFVGVSATMTSIATSHTVVGSHRYRHVVAVE